MVRPLRPPPFSLHDMSSPQPSRRPWAKRGSYDDQAAKISSAIDEQIRQDAAKKAQTKSKEVKVMLLGQAESGKSTLQKQFQLYYASTSLDQERPSWRPVVYLNIIKAVRTIFDELEHELASRRPSSPSYFKTPSSPPSTTLSLSDATLVELPASGTGVSVHAEVAHLRGRLLPLLALEDALASELGGGVHGPGGRTGLYVRSGWQALVSPSLSWSRPTHAPSPSSKVDATANLVARTLGEREAEIEALWVHPAVQTLLRLRVLRLDESAPFFLDHIDRICEPDYLPSTGDILNVRLQTLGVKEHVLNMHIAGQTFLWRMYDVGGAKGQRHAWVPYFDDATAIIFLAPVSAFDQYLEEDPRTNRIDDSLQLFTAICSNKLLSNAHLVLLLNKADLLRKKLEAGIKVRKFITSYGDRPNTYHEVSEYFKAHFIQVHRRKDVARRPLYLHFTTMLDVEASQRIVVSVGEAIVRSYISASGLL